MFCSGYNAMLACAGVAQLVERNLAKVEVASSRLVSRSKIFRGKAICFPFLVYVGACRGSRPGTANDAPASLWDCWQTAGAVTATCTRRGGRVVMQRPAKPCTPVRFRPPPPTIARMVKLVDTRDLKSLGPNPAMPVRSRLRVPSGRCGPRARSGLSAIPSSDIWPTRHFRQ